MRRTRRDQARLLAVKMEAALVKYGPEGLLAIRALPFRLVPLSHSTIEVRDETVCRMFRREDALSV